MGILDLWYTKAAMLVSMHACKGDFCAVRATCSKWQDFATVQEQHGKPWCLHAIAKSWSPQSQHILYGDMQQLPSSCKAGQAHE